jgi:DNA topoisomerase-1
VQSATAQKRAMSHAAKEVARYLGNTPAVARSSYIDPRVFDSFQRVVAITPVLLEGVRTSEYIENRTR